MGVEMDVQRPTITEVTTTAGNYGIDNTITIELSWSEEVTVSSDTVLNLSNGATATYSSGTGGTSIIFTYTVVETSTGNTNSDNLQLTDSPYFSGTIKDLAGNDADINNNPTNNIDNNTIKVKSQRPNEIPISNISTTGSTETGFYTSNTTAVLFTLSAGQDIYATNLTGLESQWSSHTVKIIYSMNAGTNWYGTDSSLDTDLSFDDSSTNVGSSTTTTGNQTITIVESDFENNTLSRKIYFGTFVTDNFGNTQQSTYDNTLFLIRDDIPPHPITLGTVVPLFGRIVSNYYNSTNDGLDVTVPMDGHDPTLPRPPNSIANIAATTLTQGTAQLLVSVDNKTTWKEIGPLSNISNEEWISHTKTIRLSNEDFVGAVKEGETAYFNVTLIDEDDNVTTSNPIPIPNFTQPHTSEVYLASGVKIDTSDHFFGADTDYNLPSLSTITRQETAPALPIVTFTKGSNKTDYNNKIVVKFANTITKWDYSINFGKDYNTYYGNSGSFIKLNNGVYMPGSIIIRNYDVADNRSIVTNTSKIIIASSRQGFPLPNNSSAMNIAKRKGHAFSRAVF